jgi:hypothetical protein
MKMSTIPDEQEIWALASFDTQDGEYIVKVVSQKQTAL